MNELLNIMTKDGDGDGDFTNETFGVTISICDNGYLIVSEKEDGISNVVFEYTNSKEMMAYLADILGVA